MNRWLVLVSRVGTAFTAIGLALLLISLIPSSSSGTQSQLGNSIQSKTFDNSFDQVMSPQESATFTVTSDTSVDVYLLEVSGSFLFHWISDNYGAPGKYFYNNVTYLKSFLGNFTQSNVYSQIATSYFSYQYTPTKITNVTLIISNPSSSFANVEESWKVSQQVAPASRVATLADLTIPIGLVLAIPWFVDLYQRRARKTVHSTERVIADAYERDPKTSVAEVSVTKNRPGTSPDPESRRTLRPKRILRVHRDADPHYLQDARSADSAP